MILQPDKYYAMQAKEMDYIDIRLGKYIQLPERCVLLREATKEEIEQKQKEVK